MIIRTTEQQNFFGWNHQIILLIQFKQIYLMISTRILCEVNKSIQPKDLVDLSKQLLSDEQNLSSSNKNVFWKQPNAVTKNILFNKLKLSSVF